MGSAYQTRKDGEWFRIPRKGHLIGCCDCGLVHLFNARVRNGSVEVRAMRMERNTAALRREHKKRNKCRR